MTGQIESSTNLHYKETKMSIFYIQSQTYGILELTATSDIEVIDNSTVTKHRLETGEFISDNVVNESKKIRFSGLISEIRRITSAGNHNGLIPKDGSATTQRNVEDYIRTLGELRNSKELFKVHYDTRLIIVDNCLLTNLTLNRNVNTGTGYDVKLSFQQVRLSAGASFIELPVQENPDLNQPETSTSDNNTVQSRAEELFGKGVTTTTLGGIAIAAGLGG